MIYTATYSPEDNKLRLYASARLDAETYGRVKAAGFIWAPKQDLFVAPMWTPSREDLLIELAGEIEDEDRSLVDRAEEPPTVLVTIKRAASKTPSAHMMPSTASPTISRLVSLFSSATTANATPGRTPSASRTA